MSTASSLKFQRVLIKVGGEAMQGDRDSGISYDSALEVAQHLKAVRDLGVDVAVVIGGGNIFRGIAGAKNGFDRATGDYMGMLATVINALALQDALLRIGVDTRVQSALMMPAVAEPFIRRRAIRHMEKGRLVIIAAGTGNPYVTTDTGASLHALELGCQVMMKATKVDGIYDKDPMKFPDARRFKTIKYLDVLSNANIQVMDSAATSMCMENNLPVMVFELFKGSNLIDAVKGKDVGTLVSNEVETQLA